MGIQRLGTELLALFQHEFIEVGQYGRIEPDAVFHQQNELHTHFIDIVFQIHLVLYQFDDGY